MTFSTFSQTNEGDVQPTVAARPDVENTELPVRQVMLFSSGVGYFEHVGSVEGQAQATLRFKADQINDLLKSLVLQDMDGGLVRAVSFPSNDPLERKLGSFQIDLSGAPTLAGLLGQLRGAKVTLDGQRTGTILGVEERTVAEGDTTVKKPFLTLVTDEGLRSMPLDAVGTFRLEDPKLREELARALATLAEARDHEKKPLRFEFDGEGERRVRLGYVVETPVWKTSYRLVLPEGDESTARVQGWAIVENQTDSDWEDVRLSLVSGRPLSFVQDLYTPLYAQRPVVRPALWAMLTPRVYEGGVESDLKRRLADGGREVLAPSSEPAARASRGLGGGGGGLVAGVPAADMDDAMRGRMDIAGSVQSAADAANLGELFEYTINRVSVARQSSAMIPIVTDPIEAERVSIYNRQVLRRNPLNGVLLTNSTDKHLLAGPVTVYDNGGYAGDAQLGDVAPGQKRLLSHGVDLKVTVDPDDRTGRRTLTTAAISRGVLRLTHTQRHTTSYVVQNEAEAARMLVIEHTMPDAAELVDTPEPYERVESLLRFRHEAPEGRSVFVVTADRAVHETNAIARMSLEQLVAISQGGRLPQRVADALAEAAELMRAREQVRSEIARIDEELEAINSEQDRMRRNMQNVDRNSDYYKRLLAKFDEQETQIEELRERRRHLEETLAQRTRALEDFIDGLEV